MVEIDEEIKKKAMRYYDKFKKESFVVKPSFPILYFGDLDKYSDSQIKIVTVGKNPSYREFCDKNRKNCSLERRFPKWDFKKKNFEETLNDYFKKEESSKKEPYMGWFRSYECLLRGLDATYGDMAAKDTRCGIKVHHHIKNVAIHTDMCTPLATDPTWSKLDMEWKKKLRTQGFDIWIRLIEDVLKPDVIIISSTKDDYCFKRLIKEHSDVNILTQKNEKVLTKITKKKSGGMRKKPYFVYYYDNIKIANKPVIVVRGVPFNVPFGSISHEDKFRVGKAIANLLTKEIIN